MTILEDVPARFYAANNSTNCNDNDKIDSHKPKSAKKQSKTKALLCSWRQSDLPILARKRQHSFLPPSRFSLYVYKKLGRRLYPYILGLGSFANSVNPFSPGFWPALFFNQLLFMEGKQLAVSVLSVAVIGGFLGFGLGGYFVNSIP